MLIQTERLTIRDLETGDGIIFSNMASDGSLHDIGFDSGCHSWINEWMAEARELADKDNPNADYLAYTLERKDTREVIGSVGCSYYEDMEKIGITCFVGAEYRNQGYATEAIAAYARYFLQRYRRDEMIATIREDNAPSWRTIEKAGFILKARKMYQDINDETEQMYRFYCYSG